MKKKAKRFIYTLYKIVFKFLGWVLPKNKKLVVFESFLGKQYSDNPRAIFEYMVKNNPDYSLYWSADKKHVGFFADNDIKYVQRLSFRWLFMMARAKYWVYNSRMPLWIPKPRHTIFLQTWHGTPLKKLAADMDQVHISGSNTDEYKQDFLKSAEKWDYLVSPNAYSTAIFKRAFQFNQTMIESGYPRNDLLLNFNNTATINEIKKRYNFPVNKKVILYAPTWRDDQLQGSGGRDLQLDLDRMKEAFGDDYILLLRLHYFVAEKLDVTRYDGYVVDCTYHEDIRELYLISDLLITDYSSVFFDYANLRRPMIFFVPDLENYRDNLRGFYFDFEKSAPGPLVKTTEEVITIIKDLGQMPFLPSQEALDFYERFCYLEDGHASERVVNEVFKR